MEDNIINEALAQEVITEENNLNEINKEEAIKEESTKEETPINCAFCSKCSPKKINLAYSIIAIIFGAFGLIVPTIAIGYQLINIAILILFIAILVLGIISTIFVSLNKKIWLL